LLSLLLSLTHLTALTSWRPLWSTLHWSDLWTPLSTICLSPHLSGLVHPFGVLLLLVVITYYPFSIAYLWGISSQYRSFYLVPLYPERCKSIDHVTEAKHSPIPGWNPAEFLRRSWPGLSWLHDNETQERHYLYWTHLKSP